MNERSPAKSRAILRKITANPEINRETGIPAAENAVAPIISTMQGEDQIAAGPKNPPPATPPSHKAAFLHNPKPRYPRRSRRLGEEGKVVLRVQVDKSGRAKTVEIKSSSGFSRLDKAAVKAVWKWRFVPAKQGGQAVDGWMPVSVVFELKG
ncbi:MAG: energy transducer TonB [Gammaproteobacteria bacterium]|nr:energy transducer TonB [Gammaproteobacteria bacterium]